MSAKTFLSMLDEFLDSISFPTKECCIPLSMIIMFLYCVMFEKLFYPTKPMGLGIYYILLSSSSLIVLIISLKILF